MNNSRKYQCEAHEVQYPCSDIWCVVGLDVRNLFTVSSIREMGRFQENTHLACSDASPPAWCLEKARHDTKSVCLESRTVE